MKRIGLILFLGLLLVSCGKTDAQDEPPDSESYEESFDESSDVVDEDEGDDDGEEYDEESEDNGYGECGLEDGTYSATVEYYNENTDHEATYTRDVEVENCEVTVIYWPSGGWSDEDHIDPGEIDSDGFAEVDGEEGRSYQVYIDK